VISREKQEQLYQEQMGKAALDRQRTESRQRCWYCGGKNGAHMNLCTNKDNKPRPA
jgi:hypothetical protein